MFAKNPRAVFQKQRIKCGRNHRIGNDECLAQGIRHRTLFWRQRI